MTTYDQMMLGIEPLQSFIDGLSLRRSEAARLAAAKGLVALYRKVLANSRRNQRSSPAIYRSCCACRMTRQRASCWMPYRCRCC